MKARTSSSNFVHFAYRLLKQEAHDDKMDLSLRANVASWEASDSFWARSPNTQRAIKRCLKPIYAMIKAVACNIADKILEKDPRLLMWYDRAPTRTGGES